MQTTTTATTPATINTIPCLGRVEIPCPANPDMHIQFDALGFCLVRRPEDGMSAQIIVQKDMTGAQVAQVLSDWFTPAASAALRSNFEREFY